MATTFHPPSAVELPDGTTLISLHDGTFRPGPEILVDPAGETETRAFQASFADGVTIDVNAFVLQRDHETILVDAGVGAHWGPDFGNAGRTLEALGIEAGSVRAVLLTHPHGDHAFGLVEPSGALRYPNAEIFCSARDIDHFLRDGADQGAGAGDAMTTRRVLESLGARLRPFGEGEILPGIEAVSLPGHTPGHSGFLVGSLTLIWGDILHLPHAQGANPARHTVFDEDAALALATRRDVMARAAEKQWLVAGAHLAFPGLGRVVAVGSDAFRVDAAT